MDITALAILLKPIGFLLLWGLVVIPVALVLRRLIPEGRVKDFLYKKRKPLL